MLEDGTEDLTDQRVEFHSSHSYFIGNDPVDNQYTGRAAKTVHKIRGTAIYEHGGYWRILIDPIYLRPGYDAFNWQHQHYSVHRGSLRKLTAVELLAEVTK